MPILKGQPLFRLVPPPAEADGVQGVNDFLEIYDLSGNLVAKIDYLGACTFANLGASADQAAVGGLAVANISVTASYTVPDWDTTANISTVFATGTTPVTLPLAANKKGRRITVKNLDASHTVTVTAAGSDHIDGATTKTLTAQYKYVTVESDGVSVWSIVANN